MLGREIDAFLIDTKTGKIYNLGEEAGWDTARKLMERISGPHDVRYYSRRFVVIGGTEWGVESFNPKTRVSRSIYNPKVEKVGKYFASQYRV